MSTTAWYSIQILNPTGNIFLNGYFYTVNNIVTRFYETVNNTTDFSNNLLFSSSMRLSDGSLPSPNGSYDGFTLYSIPAITFDNAYRSSWLQFDNNGIMIKPTSNSYTFSLMSGLSYVFIWANINEITNHTSDVVFMKENYIYNVTSNFTTTISPTVDPTIPKPYPCFKENTQILTDQGYKYIQHLKKGDLVKTVKQDYKPLILLGKKVIEHNPSPQRIKNQLYKCSPTQYPDVFEDIVLTGCHSILTPQFSSPEEREHTIQINGDTYVTDGYYRLPACCDERATVYETPGTYTIYHLVLENEDYYMNYGIYANGLLVESCSEHNLKKLFSDL